MLIVLPYRDCGCPFRRAARVKVLAHLADVGPIVEVDDGGPLFSRAGSLNLAFEQSDADIVVACDADLLVDLGALTEAVTLAEQPGMVIPFKRVDYLGPKDEVRWRFRPCDETPLVGGCNVLSRETWERAGGWDARFRGWGCEDVAFARACEKVAPLRRVGAKATHLYHPKGGRYLAAEAANGELLRRIDAR